MQAGEFIFKVPKVRKRWRSLYCTEKMSELNKAWERSDAESTSSVRQGNSLPVARNLFSVKPEEIVDQDTSLSCGKEAVQCITPIKTVHEHGFNVKEESDTVTENQDLLCKASPRNKYTVGLFEELRTSATGPVCVAESCSQNGSDNSERSFLQQAETNREQVLDSVDEEIRGHIHAKASVTTPDSAPGSPDVLIIQDESMTTYSDDDWESTTPPAPRSPSDQAVPDLTDPYTIHTPSDHQLFPGPFLLPQTDEWSVPETQENAQSSVYQQISSLEFVFTDLFY